MTDTQKHLLKLLLEIDEICKKHDIEYFLDYGTILGAVRHEGFIPWDDDLDITMTEENYNKWVQVCETELDKTKRVFADVRMDREFPTVVGRYNDLESARIGQHGKFWSSICGQCIDVFCMMELPKDPIEKQKAIDRYYAYDEYVNKSYRHYRMKTESWMKLYKKYRLLGKIFGREAVLRRLEKKIFNQHYEDCDTYLVASARKNGPKSIIPKVYFDTSYMADFEGYRFRIPGKYVECMRLHYGDSYCMIPEGKDRKEHSKMSETNLPCADYVDDFMRFIDKDKLLKERYKFKHLDVVEGYWTTQLRQELYTKMGYVELLKIQKKIDEKHIVVREHLDSSNRDKMSVLNALFSNYYDKQLNKFVREWDVYFDIGDELLYAALYILIYYRADFSSAAKILNLRQINRLPLTDEMQNLSELITIIREIDAAIVYKEYDKAEKYLEEGLANYPDCKQIQIFELILKTEAAKSDEQLLECEQLANDLLKRYPKNDYCKKALGDIFSKRGDKKKANEHYKWVLKNSANGMLHLDIKKRQVDKS